VSKADEAGSVTDEPTAQAVSRSGIGGGPGGPGLTWLAEPQSAGVLLRMAGRLDLTTVVDLRTSLDKLLAQQPAAIVVDLSEVTVADDLALTAFTAFARAAAGWPGCPVLLSASTAHPRAMLDRMAVSRTLPVYSDPAEALAAADAMPAPRRYHRQLPATPAAAASARQVVAEACRAWGLAQLAGDAELVATELVANAVRHAAGSDLHLLVILRQRFVHVSVRDGSPQPPRRVLPDPETGEGGRGLILVDAVARGWGSTPIPDGKVVWATLSVG
jgi:anti-sigma regulatory factor (Ser/Thr protein kinase)/ABC-type transporter Mla MlaB component